MIEIFARIGILVIFLALIPMAIFNILIGGKKWKP